MPRPANPAATGTHVLELADTAVIVDTVEYGNLTPGERYTLHGTLHVKDADGKDLGVFKPANNGSAEATTIFTPATSDGEVTMRFTVDTASLGAGQEFVVFEELMSDDGTHIASHMDISSSAQSIHTAKIGTTLVDAGNKKHEAAAESSATVVDTVKYEGLEPGAKYRVTGVLYDKSTKKEFVAGGKNVTATTEFTAEKANGTVEVTFEIKDTVMAGATVVAFERLYAVGDDVPENTLVARHEDLDDKEQAVAYHAPGLGDVFDKTGYYLLQYWWVLMAVGVVLAIRGYSLMVSRDPVFADDGDSDETSSSGE